MKAERQNYHISVTFGKKTSKYTNEILEFRDSLHTSTFFLIKHFVQVYVQICNLSSLFNLENSYQLS